MTDDIVTRLRELDKYGEMAFDNYIATDAADEIERLRKMNIDMAARNSAQNADQLRIVRAVEEDRDRWRTAAKMMIAQIDPESPAWAEYWKVQRGEQ